jgi:L-arabinokinase
VPTPPSVVFYITGHGFGHASRDIEVINAILRRRPDVRIAVRSRVSREMFGATGAPPVERHEIETDTGVVQIDSLTIDEEQTACRAAEFYATFDERVAREASALAAFDAAVVVGDIPPLAFAAADAAAIPSVALGNFTWDWIYAAYPQFDRTAGGVIARIREAYRSAALALRLPLHGGFEPMLDVVRDIPFIARKARQPREVTRARLEIGDGRAVLASFGGHGLRLPYAEIARRNRFTLIVADCEIPAATPAPGRLRCFTSAQLAAAGLRYEDVVAAADVVVSKPGYGIVSECIANRTRLLYTSRGRFLEYGVFVAEMPRLLPCRHVPQEDLLAGNWEGGVQALLQQSFPAEPPTDGADVAAAEILRLAGPPLRGLR